MWTQSWCWLALKQVYWKDDSYHRLMTASNSTKDCLKQIQISTGSWTGQNSLPLHQKLHIRQPCSPTATDKHAVNKFYLLKMASMLDKRRAVQHWQCTPRNRHICITLTILAMRSYIGSTVIWECHPMQLSTMRPQSAKVPDCTCYLLFPVLSCLPISGKPPQTPVVPCGKVQTHWSSNPCTCYMHP